MRPREHADAAAEDAALDGTPPTGGRAHDARPEASALEGRYGRTPARRRRERFILFGGAIAFAIVLVSWVVWAGLDGSRPQVQATDLGHRLLDTRAVEVTWRLSVPAGTGTACAVQALNEDFTVVGWKVVEIPASERPLRTFTETVRTAQEANTGLVSNCWVD
ncbi:DUF4307 domain-containing protein [Agromyces marinus]|uniref:DUF4307 domain-containing protein n=1 Tax=Agromyces marinus TaxID=1389020 RepID=A0ABN6YEI3_9MICO|nr:DUF4307 domain-containing protein [Agromyces marinus]UIP59139.1 hypothetical protein DSM26151_20350 [Agromyces marinus]BDZ55867.1 hypothetical protein GCM10025870_29400 [Agromyces marinus]